MKLPFRIEALSGSRVPAIDTATPVVAERAGRDLAAIEHHVEVLFAISVLCPGRALLCYRAAEDQRTSLA